MKFRTPEDCEAAVARLDGREFNAVGLPDRHADMSLELFLDWETKNPTASLYLGDPGNIPSLGSGQVDLMRKLDAILKKDELRIDEEEHEQEPEPKKRRVEERQDRDTEDEKLIEEDENNHQSKRGKNIRV